MSNNMIGIGLQEACGPITDLLQKLSGPTSNAWLEELKKFLKKEKTWSQVIPIDRSEPFGEKVKMNDVEHLGPLLDVVRLNNSEALLLHPEYENQGPSELDMGKIGFLSWQTKSPDEARGCNRLYMKETGEGWVVSLEGLYKYLCLGGQPGTEWLGLRDASAMSQNLEYVPTALKGGRIYLWKGLAKSSVNGKLFVPYLYIFVSRKVQRPSFIGWQQVTDVSIPVDKAKNLVARYF